MTLVAPRLAPDHAFSWPDKAAVRVYLGHAAVVGALFFVGYGGANWLAGQRDVALQVYWGPELSIPLIPEMIWAYLSINLLFLLPLFTLDVPDLRLLGRRMIAATVIAVAVFPALPTTLGFARLDLAADPNVAFALLYSLDQPYNCVPSLHVAYSALIVAAVAPRCRPWVAVLLLAWLLLVMASTLLTHQHHMIDIATALAMVGGIHLVLTRMEARQ